VRRDGRTPVLQSAALPAFGAAYLALSVLQVLRHEMWRDELELWALVRHNSSFADLVYQYRHRGHPLLWPLCVSLVHRLTDNPLAMQLLHAVIATAAVLVMARCAPWSSLQKAALAFSYGLFYEYNTIARSYAPGVLLAFAACALLCTRRRRWWLLAGTLFLLAQTSVYGLIIAFAFSTAVAVECVAGPGEESAGQRNLPRFAGFSAVVALGALLSVVSMIGSPDRVGPAAGPAALDSGPAPSPPPAPGTAGESTPVRFRLAGRALTRVWRAYVPIPQLQLHFWNTNILEEHRPLQAVLSILLLAAGYLMMRDSRAALAFWLSGTAGLLVFMGTVFDGYQRHHGHLFLVFLAAWWIREGAASGRTGRRERPGKWMTIADRAVIGILLSCQAAAGIYASVMDVLHPFSMSREVARHVAALGGNDTIVSDADHAGTAVAIWLDRPFYQVASGQYGITIALGVPRKKHVLPAEILEAARRIKAAHPDGVLLLVNHPLPPRPGFRLLRTFDGAICASEEYALFRVE